jgi:hypothetical protein
MSKNGKTPTDGGKLATTVVNVTLDGTLPIMFDRYSGSNQIELPWDQKIYTRPGSDVLVFPTINIISFLSGINTTSAPKRTMPAKTYKNVCMGCLSSVLIRGDGPDGNDCVPFLRDDEPIRIGEFGVDSEPLSGLYKAIHVARLKGGVPNPKERPVLPLPWRLRFQLLFVPNEDVTLAEIRNLFVRGGQTIGFGTFRGAFGKFEVTGWE